MRGTRIEIPGPPDGAQILQDVQGWARTFGAAARSEPSSTPEPEPALLDRIDRAIGGLCPCGAPPRPGSAYCGYDCEPTHLTPETEPRYADVPSTPMRWRPDLVSAVDDAGLVPFTPRTALSPGLWVEVFERAGTTRLHVRLDDGHRFVGADVDRQPAATFAARYEAKVAALDNELGDRRRVAPNGSAAAELLLEAARRRAAAARPGRAGYHIPTRPVWHWAGPAPGARLFSAGRASYHNPATVSVPIRIDPEGARQFLTAVSRAANGLAQAAARILAAGAGAQTGPAVAAGAPPDARERIAQARRGRNTGPRQGPPVPRRIDPRRAR